jgi:hypothetical protein
VPCTLGDLILRALDYIVTISSGYILNCGFCNLCCGRSKLFCNVWVRVCVGFVKCGCFGNMCTGIYCVLCFCTVFLCCSVCMYFLFVLSVLV